MMKARSSIAESFRRFRAMPATKDYTDETPQAPEIIYENGKNNNRQRTKRRYINMESIPTIKLSDKALSESFIVQNLVMSESFFVLKFLIH